MKAEMDTGLMIILIVIAVLTVIFILICCFCCCDCCMAEAESPEMMETPKIEAKQDDLMMMMDEPEKM